MHGDPLSVLGMLVVFLTTAIAYMYSFPSRYTSPPLSLTLPIKYHVVSYLQSSGSTALILASWHGYTKIVQSLLAAADIDVNHETVGIYPLTPSHAVVGSEGRGCLQKKRFPAPTCCMYPLLLPLPLPTALPPMCL